jgi:hypothetical protein
MVGDDAGLFRRRFSGNGTRSRAGAHRPGDCRRYGRRTMLMRGDRRIRSPVAFLKHGGIQVSCRLGKLVTWSRLLTAAGVAAGMVLAPAVASATPRQFVWPLDTCVLANPAYGSPTAEVHVYGCGFASFEPVEVTFGSPLVARAMTDGFGRFRTEFLVPPTASGATEVKATGLVSNKSKTMNYVVVSPFWIAPPGRR